ncbi:hypothetical protein PF010_g5852 [Phytophthora fragariae]|uniref:PiggyBac transposable element-derived protein 4 C-terminal zinc-ribbon domain-containing protein n=2 Tax=Phytophthora fragariae TaxID=53985 RepID=A0A6A3UI29_9STRA|nr:hypothetical protein PF009_g7295 [Phytophthora fragariae]KAE9018946.1 hypothetical protein PF011_g6038 [Phytophthora fragariae]KAE9124850.1 hypothetical protein PF010_g5852 [Phytophthora fragariae]KAE9150493.1 hypothetical protein PF006_g5129 [Phytophthora fragariae]
MQKIRDVVRHRQHQCKVCSVHKSKVGERVTTKWYCPACSCGKKRAYLCDRTRPHSKNGYTFHQVCHLEWANGVKRPRPNVGRDIQMRATRVKSSRTRAPDDSAAGAEDFSDEAQSSGDQRRIRGQPRTRRRLIACDRREGAQVEQGDEALECAGDVHKTAGSQGPTAERQPTSNEIQPSAEIVETTNV